MQGGDPTPVCQPRVRRRSIEIASQKHSCEKMKFNTTIGRLLQAVASHRPGDNPATLPVTATTTCPAQSGSNTQSAAFVYCTSQLTLGLPQYAARLAESTSVTAGTGTKMWTRHRCDRDRAAPGRNALPPPPPDADPEDRGDGGDVQRRQQPATRPVLPASRAVRRRGSGRAVQPIVFQAQARAITRSPQGGGWRLATIYLPPRFVSRRSPESVSKGFKGDYPWQRMNPGRVPQTVHPERDRDGRHVRLGPRSHQRLHCPRAGEAAAANSLAEPGRSARKAGRTGYPHLSVPASLTRIRTGPRTSCAPFMQTSTNTGCDWRQPAAPCRERDQLCTPRRRCRRAASSERGTPGTL